MLNQQVTLRAGVLALVLAGLAACGGGGGGGSGGSGSPSVGTLPEPVPTPCRVKIVADTSVAAGKTAGATVQSCTGEPLKDMTWSQVSGPQVTMLATRSQTLALETSTPGTIRLRGKKVSDLLGRGGMGAAEAHRRMEVAHRRP